MKTLSCNLVPRGSMPRRQTGVVLVIALIVLLLVTMLGVSTLRANTMQERMAGNSRDRDKALQAAEAAVQACLAQIDGATFPAALVLTPVAAGATQNWAVATNWTDSSKSQAITVDDDAGLQANPRCMAERLSATEQSFRVTGRAVGGSQQTVVMLQATMSAE